MEKEVIILVLLCILFISGCTQNETDSTEEPGQQQDNITGTFCDANNPCPSGFECYSFPVIGTKCVNVDPCSYYECPAGQECTIIETYPPQIICQTIETGNIPTKEPAKVIGNYKIYDVMQDEIFQGQTLKVTYVTESDIEEVSFILDHQASDIDLHVYDSEGNHVGFNYETNEDETNIPGSGYTGHLSNPEIIKIPLTQTSRQTFNLEVKGINTNGAEWFSIDAIELVKS